MTGKVLDALGDHEKFLNPGRVPLKRIKAFLLWLANLTIDDPAATDKFLRDFGDFFFPNQQFRRHQEIVALIKKGELPERPAIDPTFDDHGHQLVKPLEGELSTEQEARARYWILQPLCFSVRQAWTDYNAPQIRETVIPEGGEAYDPREREWIINVDVRRHFWQWLKGGPKYPTPLFPVLQYRFCPPDYRFEQAMEYLTRNLHLAKLCANRFCSNEYFLAAKANRIYCCDECAAPAKKAAKLKWWNENRKRKERK